MLQKNLLLPFFLQFKKVMVQTVAVKKLDYFVHKYEPTTKVSFAPVLNKMQHMSLKE